MINIDETTFEQMKRLSELLDEFEELKEEIEDECCSIDLFEELAEIKGAIKEKANDLNKSGMDYENIIKFIKLKMNYD